MVLRSRHVEFRRCAAEIIKAAVGVLPGEGLGFAAGERGIYFPPLALAHAGRPPVNESDLFLLEDTDPEFAKALPEWVMTMAGKSGPNRY